MFTAKDQYTRGCSTLALQALRCPIPSGISHGVPRGPYEESLPVGCLCPQTAEALASALGRGGFSVLLSFIVNKRNIKHELMSISRNVDHVQKQPPCLPEVLGDTRSCCCFSHSSTSQHVSGVLKMQSSGPKCAKEKKKAHNPRVTPLLRNTEYGHPFLLGMASFTMSRVEVGRTEE